VTGPLPPRPNRRGVDVLAGGQSRGLQAPGGLKQEVLTVGRERRETHSDRMRQLVVVRIAARSDRRLDAQGKLQRGVPLPRARCASTLLAEAMVGNGHDVSECPLWIDAWQGSQDREQRELSRVFRVVPPDGGR
jgi:hypothetical protein